MRHIQSGTRSPSLRELLNRQQDSFQRALGGGEIRLFPRPTDNLPKQEPVQISRDMTAHPSSEKREEGEGFNETE